MMIFVSLAGLFGRFGMSYLSDAIGPKASGGIFGLGSATVLLAAALCHNIFFGASVLAPCCRPGLDRVVAHSTKNYGAWVRLTDSETSAKLPGH